MLGRMRLGASSGAVLSSEDASRDAADATQAQGASDGPAAAAAAGGTGATTAASASAAVATAAQQHPNLIGTVVGKMGKIQREGRGRRYRVSFGVAWPAAGGGGGRVVPAPAATQNLVQILRGALHWREVFFYHPNTHQPWERLLDTVCSASWKPFICALICKNSTHTRISLLFFCLL